MTAAIFGLVGVIVGGVMNGAITAVLRRWTEGSERRTAARLVRSELVRFYALAREAERRPPENLPQLRETTPILWQAHRDVLAHALKNEGWELVARAYAHVDALLSVLVFEPDGTLIEWRTHEAQRLLALMIDPVEEAVAALRKAAGVPSDWPDDLADLSSNFPVAA
jgi:hypothetical protein